MKYRLCATVLALFGILLPAASEAAEGASSHYLPGVAGDMGYALKPEPGFQLINMIWHQSGEARKAVIQGRVDFGLDVDVTLDLVGGFYTFDAPILGNGALTIGAILPIGPAKLKADARSKNGNSRRAKDTSFAMSDLAITPLQLNWNTGKFHFKFAETIIAPTGNYDKGRFLNMGRNYWSFDTAVALTWMNPGTGTEFSIQPGIMFNTKNKDTEYKTGTEFHVDVAANQFVTKTFALGIHAYHYNQITDDTGRGAKLGDFQSQSTGVGPGFGWIKGAAAVTGKWIWDVHSKRRFDSSYGTLSVGWKF